MRLNVTLSRELWGRCDSEVASGRLPDLAGALPDSGDLILRPSPQFRDVVHSAHLALSLPLWAHWKWRNAVKRMMVTAVAMALLALASGTGSAEMSNNSAPQREAFPKYEDPWRHWGKPRPDPVYVHPSYPNHYFVWVQGYWWWSGEQWVWVPGYWVVW